MKNTTIWYLNRDVENNKTHRTVTFAGLLTPEQFDQMKAACFDSDAHFNPQQVNLPAERNYDYLDDLDIPWWELDGFEFTNDPPTDARTIQEFLIEFCSYKNNWEPEAYD